MTMRPYFCTPLFDYLRATLRGIGQIFFQENAWTGLLLLAGIAVNSPTMAAGAALGAGVATLLALAFDDGEGRASGLYGFNGALTGVAVLAFMAPHPGAWMLAMVGAVWTALMMRLWGRVCALPPYTAPFVLSTWVLLYVASGLGLPAAPAADLPIVTEFGAVLRGVGQVVFQGNAWSGALFVIALAVHSRRAAVWALIASALGMACARASGLPTDLIAMGLYGFNAVLVAEALRIAGPGRFGIPSVLGVVLSVAMTYVFQRAGALSLTAPFILSAWVVLLLVRGLQRSSPDPSGVGPGAP